MEKTYTQPQFEVIRTDEPNKVFFATSSGDCLTSGTCVTMADGSFKKIEDIAEGDNLRTFDHEAGGISSSRVCLAWKCDVKKQPLRLTFSSGRSLSIVGTHDLLLENTRKYVRVNKDNVAGFIGKRFYNAETGVWDELVNHSMEAPADYYCIYTAGHLNCIAEGMLTCPDDVDFILNIYDLDENLKADANRLAIDIAQYGLLDIERDYPDFLPHKVLMEALQCRYQKIAIGKGLMTESEVALAREFWNAYHSAV